MVSLFSKPAEPFFESRVKELPTGASYGMLSDFGIDPKDLTQAGKFMRYVYPAEPSREPNGSAVNFWFLDVPGARTSGDDAAEALTQAKDCLVTALYGCVRYGEAIPRPGPARGRPVIAVPLVAAKLALYTAMRESGMSEAELAARLGVSQKVVQSILHLKRRVHIGHLERALAERGVHLEVTVEDAA